MRVVIQQLRQRRSDDGVGHPDRWPHDLRDDVVADQWRVATEQLQLHGLQYLWGRDGSTNKSRKRFKVCIHKRDIYLERGQRSEQLLSIRRQQLTILRVLQQLRCQWHSNSVGNSRRWPDDLCDPMVIH